MAEARFFGLKAKPRGLTSLNVANEANNYKRLGMLTWFVKKVPDPK